MSLFLEIQVPDRWYPMEGGVYWTPNLTADMGSVTERVWQGGPVDWLLYHTNRVHQNSESAARQQKDIVKVLFALMT